ncbi:MAG: hypothetical protein HC915_20920, partial [Anaerolineae bacterium]|nr:hypothetical protein [Anaerolineae bacterium]
MTTYLLFLTVLFTLLGFSAFVGLRRRGRSGSLGLALSYNQFDLRKPEERQRALHDADWHAREAACRAVESRTTSAASRCCWKRW